MANSYNTSPVVITAAMTGTSYKAQTLTSLGSLNVLRVEKIEWIRQGAAGNQVVILDPSNNQVLWSASATAANTPVKDDWIAAPRIWRDFQVNQIDSGILYIWLR